MVTDKASTARWMGLALGAVLAACGTGGGQDSALSLDRDRGRGGGSGNGGGNGGGGSGGGGSAEGAALYADSCAGCHGPLASSEVAGASSGSIIAAINGNVGGMGSLSLTAAQVDAISLALGGTGGGGGGSGDGATLYAASCAGCHGPLASSEVRGESASSIREAIADNEGGMGSLTLTDAELTAIASALGGTGGGGDDDGEEHGDDGEDHGDDDDGDGGGGGGGSAEGAALYEANCAGCHGALASSQVRGESASSIREAITDDEGGMGSLTLTDAELTAIASALGGTGGGGGDDDLRSGVPSLSRRAAHPVTLRTALALR